VPWNYLSAGIQAVSRSWSKQAAASISRWRWRPSSQWYFQDHVHEVFHLVAVAGDHHLRCEVVGQVQLNAFFGGSFVVFAYDRLYELAQFKGLHRVIHFDGQVVMLVGVVGSMWWQEGRGGAWSGWG
jgi:hypothetical protein